MGSVNMRNGIGFSEESGARYFDMAAIATNEERAKNPIKQTIPDNKLGSMPWSPWGTNNLLPMEMTVDIETCGILNSIIDAKARFALCNGVQPVITRINPETGVKEVEKYVDDAEVMDFLDMNDSFFQVYGWMKDLVGFGQGVCRYGLNRKKDPKIILFQRDDVTEFRYAKKNAKGIIEDIWLAAEWNLVRGMDDKRVFSVPNLNPHNPVADLERRVAGGNGREFALTFKYPGWQKHYYSMPLWYAAYKWVKIAQGVPEMKAAIFQNSIHVKYNVVIWEKYWEKAFGPDWKKYTQDQKKDKMRQVYDDIDKFLVGSKNAYKSIFSNGYRDKDGKMYTEIEIKPVEDTMKEGKLLPDSAAANSEIAFAEHYNNTIMGGNQAAGPYDKSSGGSNIRESILMQVIMMELERQHVRRILSVPAHFNGWKKRLGSGLDFIIPATVLTTLDTGSGTKPITTGDTKEKDNNGTN